MFQSTRPRGARLTTSAKMFLSLVFQSTRPRGARLSNRSSTVCLSLFQSTRPRGARPCTGKFGVGGDKVSIHAPARGATCQPHDAERDHSCFNPRAREGRDGLLSRNVTMGKSFNPRAREGRDETSCSWRTKAYRFQSTRPRGARPVFARLTGILRYVSIHAPARGATLLF